MSSSYLKTQCGRNPGNTVDTPLGTLWTLLGAHCGRLGRSDVDANVGQKGQRGRSEGPMWTPLKEIFGGFEGVFRVCSEVFLAPMPTDVTPVNIHLTKQCYLLTK
jgi:hypothetical protein